MQTEPFVQAAGLTLDNTGSQLAGESMQRRILITDDSETLHTMLRDTLEPEGHRLFHAMSGLEALVNLERARPDVAFVDVNMPGMGGLELIAKFTKRCPELPVIVLTAERSRHLRHAARRIGAVAWMTKPICPAAIRAAARFSMPAPSPSSTKPRIDPLPC